MSRPRHERGMLLAVKTVHTLIWFTVESALGYVIWAGWRGRADRRVGAAAAVVAGESLVYLGNRARCPLTGLAQSLGADHGSVTDIFLPPRLAHSLPVLHVPLVALALALHRRTLRRQLGRTRTPTARRPGGGTPGRRATPRPGAAGSDPARPR